jgi:hypothetical protein
MTSSKRIAPDLQARREGQISSELEIGSVQESCSR